MGFAVLLVFASLAAGTVASVSGFGIGSLLTPLLSLKTGIGTAVAGVAVAHLCGTALRFFLMHRSLNRAVFLRFGLASAVGGLAGALLHNYFQNVVLTVVFGCLLIIAGLLELTGLASRLALRGPAVWLEGALSGLFGGLVGNQGGIRSAALLGFHLKREEFVATATAAALVVDAVRLPVYLAFQWSEMAAILPQILIATLGVIAGTLAGTRLLSKIPERRFKKAVAAVILLVGILVLVQS
jgi:uncharacterized protein